MKKRFPTSLLAGLFAVAVAGSASSVMSEAAAVAPRLTWHFAGARNLADGTDGALLRKALAQPATGQMLEQAWEKLATAPQRLAAKQLKDPSVDLAGILRPAIADLANCQSFGSWNGPAEWALGVETGPGTGDRWVADWAKAAQALGGGAPEEVAAGDAGMRVVRLPEQGVATACGRLGHWVGIAVGTDPAAQLERLADEARTALQAGSDAWLELRGNPRALTGSSWVPDARVHLRLTGAGERVRTVATATFSEPLNLKLDPWQLPTEAIREPLIGFSAARSIAPLLAKLPVLSRPEMAPLPNQATVWTLGVHPFQTYAAWPEASPKETLKRIAPVLAGEFRQRLAGLRGSEVLYQPELNRAVVTNLINASPFLEAAPESAPGFLVGGISLPLYLRGEPAPEELFAQVTDKPNLVFFNWELTQPRVEMMWHLRTYRAMLAGYLPLPAGGALNGWLRDPGFTGCLGNTAAEITLESPSELKLVRVSAVGFTALELTWLAVWLDGDNFPLRSKPKTVLDRVREKASQPATSPKPRPKPGSAPRRTAPRR